MASADMPQQMPSIPLYRTRLSVLFAANAPKAVILRRGPKKHFRLIMWDLDTDTFTLGQWMKGEVHLCDLSPDGRKLLVWAAQYHAKTRKHLEVRTSPYSPETVRLTRRQLMRRPKRKIPRYMRATFDNPKRPPRSYSSTWTALSTPPYFTALAIWPSVGTWTGGGVFTSNWKIVLRESDDGLTPIENVPLPATLQIDAAQKPADLQRSAYDPECETGELHDTIYRALTECSVTWIDWIYPQPSADLFFAAAGCIYKLKHWKNVPAQAYLAEARLIADFRNMRFELMSVPVSAMEW
jgi:hypothetical protein